MKYTGRERQSPVDGSHPTRGGWIEIWSKPQRL